MKNLDLVFELRFELIYHNNSKPFLFQGDKINLINFLSHKMFKDDPNWWFHHLLTDTVLINCNQIKRF